MLDSRAPPPLVHGEPPPTHALFLSISKHFPTRSGREWDRPSLLPWQLCNHVNKQGAGPASQCEHQGRGGPIITLGSGQGATLPPGATYCLLQRIAIQYLGFSSEVLYKSLLKIQKAFEA